MQEGVRCGKFLAGLTKTFFNTVDTSVTAVPWLCQFYLVTLLFFCLLFFSFLLSCLLTCLLVRSFVLQFIRSFPFLYVTLQMPTWQPVLLCEVLDCTQWARKLPHGLVCLLLYKVGKYLGPVSGFSGSNAGQKKKGGPPCPCSFIVQHTYQLCFDSRYATQPDSSGPYAVSYIAKALNHPSSSSELPG